MCVQLVMKIGVIGLGYVGIQLAVAFGRRFDTVGFDPDHVKIKAYNSGIDHTGEVTQSQFKLALKAVYTSNINELLDCQIYIVAVPTPVDEQHLPDFGPLLKASETVGQVMAPGAVVVYESTVY
ncbi:uncharacterized protein METZ01_LOCUS394693, partial [marine metagenome]